MDLNLVYPRDHGELVEALSLDEVEDEAVHRTLDVLAEQDPLAQGPLLVETPTVDRPVRVAFAEYNHVATRGLHDGDAILDEIFGKRQDDLSLALFLQRHSVAY